MLRPFQFATLALSRNEDDDDDEEVAFAKHNLAGVSTICLEVWKVEPMERVDTGITTSPSALSLHERQLKKVGRMRDTLTTFGKAIQLPPRRPLRRTRRVDHEPLATFLFNYSSEDILEAEGIITPDMVQIAAREIEMAGSEVRKAEETIKQEGNKKRFTREDNVVIDLAGPSKRRFTKEDKVVVDLTSEE